MRGHGRRIQPDGPRGRDGVPVYDAKRLPADAEADRSGGIIQKRSRDDEAMLPVDGGGIITPGGTVREP